MHGVRSIYGIICKRLYEYVEKKKINSVRGAWNSPEKCDKIAEVITQAIEAKIFERELQYALKGILDKRRYWADPSCSQADDHAAVAPPDQEDGYKVFGHINQMFRRHVNFRLSEPSPSWSFLPSTCKIFALPMSAVRNIITSKILSIEVSQSIQPYCRPSKTS